MKQLGISIIAAALGGVTWWLVSPLLFDVSVNDVLPESFPSHATTTGEPAAPTVPEAPITDSNTTTSEPSLASHTSGERVSNIQDTPQHPASGQVRIVTTPEEQIIRYENYHGTNGPDLRIYLADDLDATNFIDLGPARANQGNINYAVPMDVAIDTYTYVLTWCRAFDTLFDYALIR